MIVMDRKRAAEPKCEPACNRRTITDLPDDVLFVIFSYLDVTSLGRLCQVCRYLRALASKDCVWLPKTRNHVIVKNKGNCRDRPSMKEKCRVSRNWEQSNFQETTLIRNRSRLLPWIQYEDSHLWVSNCNSIKSFKVHKSGRLSSNYVRLLQGLEEDVARFVVKKDLTVSACRDGSVCGWENSSGVLLFHFPRLHASDTHCVDIANDTLVSGSRDATIKVTSLSEENEYERVKKTLTIGDRVWSLQISPDASMVAIGSAGCRGVPPLGFLDLNSGEMVCQLGMDHKHGAGILDMKFDTPHTLLTCGYDTILRIWDLRTETCVCQWEEPFDTALYCVQTDGQYTILTGTARYGMVRLWDKRKTQAVQMYYTGQRSSPVYSLAFDFSHLYVALDLSVNLIDFSTHK